MDIHQDHLCCLQNGFKPLHLGACAAEINRTESGPLRAVPFRPLFLLIFRTKPAKLLK